MSAATVDDAEFGPDAGEHPDLPPRSGAATVLDACAAIDAAISHAQNLQAAIDDIRTLVGVRYTRYPFADIREILERHGV